MLRAPQDDLNIKEITGITESGVTCKEFSLQDDDEPKRKFHIVADGDGGCLILPASVQYHFIRHTTWQENNVTIQQEDHYHPGTKEAILKTPAHGKNLATTMIFQKNDASSRRRSTEFGIMVTSVGSVCHVNELKSETGRKNK